jgi:hypothetical protein
MRESPIAIIPYNEVNFKFVEDHYDFNLSGTCVYNHELCEFEAQDPEYNEELDEYGEIYVEIYELTMLEQLKWLWTQFKFEQCVGYHWSYPQREQGYKFHIRNPKWLYKWLLERYYKTKLK